MYLSADEAMTLLKTFVSSFVEVAQSLHVTRPGSLKAETVADLKGSEADLIPRIQAAFDAEAQLATAVANNASLHETCVELSRANEDLEQQSMRRSAEAENSAVKLERLWALFGEYRDVAGDDVDKMSTIEAAAEALMGRKFSDLPLR